MFFDTLLLNFQHNGNFGKAWIAATRGIRFISTKDVTSINVIRLCDDLYKFIVSSSGDPKKRFSLRMSAIYCMALLEYITSRLLFYKVPMFEILRN
nr:unnamed protein product [Callosobruchus analis]